MNLLPKTSEEFAQKDYWNSFFKKRGDKAFEWYGEYLELCDHIHKYVKTADKILMLGCGNSKLSMDMYDSGFKDIVNIDISPVAIKKMIDINRLIRSEMKFLTMDATEMTFENESFSVALDKGTLDALFVDNTTEVRAKVEKYLKEVVRTMRNGGRYLCVSLLQKHILRYLLDFFPKNSFMVRIVHCVDVGNVNKERNNGLNDAMTMPVFLIVATKFKSLSVPILEFSLTRDKMKRVETVKELKSAVHSVQQASLVCNGLARSSIAGLNEVQLDLCLPDGLEKYTVHVLEQPPARNLKKYAAFIVPQGREHEWLFGTPQGRQKLLASANFQRLAIVSFRRDHDFDSLDAVKNELADSIRTLAPGGLTDQIPFLSLGEDVGKRFTMMCGYSKMSGNFRVEEVENDDGKVFRRLIFMSNELVIQSEALIKTITLKGNKIRRRVDVGYLACQHHLYMSVGVQMIAPTNSSSKDPKNVLVVGLGGGGLCTFLHAALPQINVTAVEIDPIMLELAEEYFNLKQDNRFHVVIDDGVAFLERCKVEGIHFDAVLFDVDSKDLTLGMSCPPPCFLLPSVLENVKSVLNANGVFILNLVCRDENLRTQILTDLQQLFQSTCSYKLDEDVNEVIYCSKSTKFKATGNWKKMLSTAGRSLNASFKTQKLGDKEILDVTDFINDLKI